MRKLIPAVIMLLISAMLVGTSTYAWFSMNRTVTVTGMQVQAKAEKSLVVSADAPTASTATRTIAMEAFTDPLTPVTHVSSLTESSEAVLLTSSGLEKLNNPDLIDPNTGIKYDGEGGTLTYLPAVNDDPTGADYYHDYVAYISSAGGEMTGMNLTVKLDVTNEVYASLATVDTWNAVTVDFYVTTQADATKGKYMGKLNLKQSGLAATADAHYSGIVNLVSNGTIPANSTGSTAYLKVTMRVYFDGALAKTVDGESGDTTSTYVRTNSANTTGIGFTAIFDCATAS